QGLYQKFYQAFTNHQCAYMGYGALNGGPDSIDASIVITLVCPSDGLPSPPLIDLTSLAGPYNGQTSSISGQDYIVGLASYIGNSGSGAGSSIDASDGTITGGIFSGGFNAPSIGILTITDGCSNTLLFGEHYDPPGVYFHNSNVPAAWAAAQFSTWTSMGLGT